jgi:hypothetical protein
VLSEVLPVLADKSLLSAPGHLAQAVSGTRKSLTDLPQCRAGGAARRTQRWRRRPPAPTAARLPEALLTEATAVKARMLKVLDYQLGDDEPVARELAAIRPGVGYLDLAQDLAQLAKLYQTGRAQLQNDRHLYQATDETLAATLSQRIFSELRRDEPTAQRERLSQATSLLVYLYEEVAATARWLLRQQPDAAERRFPSLIAATRRPRKKAPTPAPQPTPPA